MRGAARTVTLLATTLAVLWAIPANAVVGGRSASEPYPWMASLQLDGSHYCGGTLVRPDRVLTAAHCVDDVERGRLSVVLGRTDLRSAAGETFRVAAVDRHERFRTDPAGGHDVALLRLDRPSSAAAIPLVGLDEAGLWAPGRTVRVTGWGTSVFLVGPAPDRLMEADLEVISDRECAGSYSAQGFDPSTQVCAGRRLVGLADSCQGDSGGPLMARDGSGAWTQVGVVSLGTGCGLPLFYGVYARIGGPALHRWIARRLDAGAPAAPGDRPQGRSRAELRYSTRLRRTPGALLLRVRSSERLTNVRATLERRGEVLARGRLALLERRGTLRLAARSVRPGRMRVRLTATDAAGRSVKRSGAVRLRR